MRIEEKPLTNWINHFYGYGSWKARFWFVGYEESGGDLPEEVAEKINYFYTLRSITPTLCDIRELYRHVTFRIEGPRAEKFATFHDHRFGKKATLHGAWKNIIAFVHGYKSEKLPDLLAYQQNLFAVLSAQTEALIPLYPLPAHNHAWYYAWLDLPQLPYLKSRTLYQEHLYAGRMRTMLELMRVHKPEVVMLYGMENINQLKKSIQEFFPAAAFKMVKAIKQHLPQHHRADVNGTTLILTTQIPALRHNRMETGFDWYAFGKQVKGI
ncbi:MAG: hypothetical protein JNJ65_11760 [Cyclobacteriaceae bacterium]|nr:hypothetical protein [Cyclobacteriaceae bacterium]